MLYPIAIYFKTICYMLHFILKNMYAIIFLKYSAFLHKINTTRLPLHFESAGSQMTIHIVINLNLCSFEEYTAVSCISISFIPS